MMRGQQLAIFRQKALMRLVVQIQRAPGQNHGRLGLALAARFGQRLGIAQGTRPAARFIILKKRQNLIVLGRDKGRLTPPSQKFQTRPMGFAFEKIQNLVRGAIAGAQPRPFDQIARHRPIPRRQSIGPRRITAPQRMQSRGKWPGRAFNQGVVRARVGPRLHAPKGPDPYGKRETQRNTTQDLFTNHLHFFCRKRIDTGRM